MGQRGQRQAGGIDGHQVKLIILNDNSSPTQVVTNYQKLITVNHVDLTFGPFSSLLTAPAVRGRAPVRLRVRRRARAARRRCSRRS